MKDGGPAFPTPESHGDDFEGMSLRDYFAAKAIQVVLSKDGEILTPPSFSAKWAYETADAMLAERDKS
jgi:hypothetical protein